MNDLKHARKRIHSRRYGHAIYEEEKGSWFFRLLYRAMIIAMCIGVFTLAFLINQKVEWVKLPASFVDFKIEDVSKWLPFENWFSLKDEAVGSFPTYAHIKDDLYANGSNTAYTIADGVVLHVQQKDDGKGSITIQQDNGVVVTYGSLTSIATKQEERILKGSVIGTYEETLSVVCVKDNAKVELEAAL